MRFSSFLLAGAAVLLRAALAAAHGSLAELESQSGFLRFEYSTDEPDPKNWIGLYDSSGGGPVDEEYVEDSLVWEYAPEAEGTVALSTAGLEPGTYTAFFLARDGYEWLADPVDVVLEPPPARFLATDVTLPNARQGDEYAQSIAGLAEGDGPTFKLGSGSPAWLSLSPDGVLSGTPDASATDDARFSVTVEDADGEDTADFTIPVRPEDSRLLQQLRVLTFNMWHGGTQVNNYHEKQVRFLATSGADVVGLQEDQGGDTVRRLAGALGWHHWASGDSMSVLSKYPIEEEYGVINRSGGVRIALDGGGQQLNFYSLHLGYDPYGPYDFCFDNMTVDEVLEREEESGRTPQIADTVEKLRENGHLEGADEVPLVVVGDFNAPSHLDWIEEVAERHCGVWGVQWPSSVKPEEAGLTDSFREAHPDPAEEPGVTWSPVFPYNRDRDREEPQDRIDFIYYKGRNLRVVESKAIVVGEVQVDPNYEDNEWTSDHRAVMTVFEWAD